MRKPCRVQANPWLFAGFAINAVYQLVHNLDWFQSGWPALLLSFGEGTALGLMAIGLILYKPERAQAIRAWKRAHFPALFR